MRRESRTWLALISLTIVVVLTGIVMAGCGQTREAGRSACCDLPQPTRPPVAVVPEGWKSATYGEVAISVPDGWAVERDTNCPDAEAAGTLLLGYPNILESCPDDPSDLSLVTVIDNRTVSVPVTAESQESQEKPEKPAMINGVPVYVGFGSPSERQWSVPSLGVEITGVGPLAPRIVSTLRRS